MVSIYRSYMLIAYTYLNLRTKTDVVIKSKWRIFKKSMDFIKMNRGGLDERLETFSRVVDVCPEFCYPPLAARRPAVKPSLLCAG